MGEKSIETRVDLLPPLPAYVQEPAKALVVQEPSVGIPLDTSLKDIADTPFGVLGTVLALVLGYFFRRKYATMRGLFTGPRSS